MEPKRNTQCPLCGADNACVPAQTGEFGTPCWCFSTTIDPAALARVPEALRGEACLCPACAGVATPATD